VLKNFWDCRRLVISQGPAAISAEPYFSGTMNRPFTMKVTALVVEISEAA
jgi:hypothetical protein